MSTSLIVLIPAMLLGIVGMLCFVGCSLPVEGLPSQPFTQYSDLTVLSKNNHGKYPDTHLVAVLQNGAEIQAHGTVEMPVWGPILGRMNQNNPQDRLLRISNLSRYVESLQVK